MTRLTDTLIEVLIGIMLIVTIVAAYHAGKEQGIKEYQERKPIARVHEVLKELDLTGKFVYADSEYVAVFHGDRIHVHFKHYKPTTFKYQELNNER